MDPDDQFNLPANNPQSQPPTPPPAVPPLEPLMNQPSIVSKRPGKKWWLIGAVAVLVLLLASAVVAYAIYTKPENVLKDALYSMINAKSMKYTGSFETISDGSKTSVSFNGQGNESAHQLDLTLTTNYLATDVKVAGSLLLQTNDATYFKLTNVKDIAAILDKQTPGLNTVLQPLVKELDNQWIKITSKDNTPIPDSAALPCSQKLLETIRSDKNEQAALQKLYDAHPFIVVKKQFANESINGVDSNHYQIASNTDAMKAFVAGLKNIPSFQAYEKCAGTPLIDNVKADPKDKSTFDIWIANWGHKLTRVLLRSNDASNAKIDATFDIDKPVTITAPKDAKSIETITKDLNAVSESLFSPNTTLTTQ